MFIRFVLSFLICFFMSQLSLASCPEINKDFRCWLQQSTERIDIQVRTTSISTKSAFYEISGDSSFEMAFLADGIYHWGLFGGAGEQIKAICDTNFLRLYLESDPDFEVIVDASVTDQPMFTVDYGTDSEVWACR